MIKKNLEDFYKELWNLPSLKLIFPLLTFFNLILILILYLYKILNILLYLFNLILITIIVIILKIKDKYITWKRLSGIILFNYTGIFLATLSFIFLKYQYSYFANAVLLSFLILSSIALLFISAINVRMLFIIGNFLALGFIGMFNTLKNSISSNWAFANLVLDFFLFETVLIITLIYLYNIKRKGEIKYNLNPLYHFRNFILTWISKESSFFENALKKTSSNKKSFEFPCIILRLRNSVKYSVLFSLPVHPGPLLSVGSSDLPSILLNKENILYLPFHGPSTHKEDLIDHEEKNRLIEILDKLSLSSDPKNELYSTEMVTIEKDGVQVKGFLLNDIPIVLISPTKDGIDDISPEIVKEINKISNNLGYKTTIIIDAHNYYSRNIVSEAEVNDKIINATQDLLSSLRDKSKKKTQIGISNIDFKKIENNEIGYGYGRVIAFKTDEFINLLILIDANNITKKFREKLYNKIEALSKKLNLKLYYEVCSTDTHVLTAKFQGNEGYYPLGYNEKTMNEIIKRIIEGIERSILITEDAELECKKVIIPPLKILANLYPIYEKISSEFIIYGKALPLFVFIISLLINYSLSFFITNLP